MPVTCPALDREVSQMGLAPAFGGRSRRPAVSALSPRLARFALERLPGERRAAASAAGCPNPSSVLCTGGRPFLTCRRLHLAFPSHSYILRHASPNGLTSCASVSLPLSARRPGRQRRRAEAASQAPAGLLAGPHFRRVPLFPRIILSVSRVPGTASSATPFDLRCEPCAVSGIDVAHQRRALPCARAPRPRPRGASRPQGRRASGSLVR